MPNVKFLRGTQSDLAKYLSSGTTAAVEGAFYLTSDTNRLYIGKDIGSGTIRAVPVNQGINTVANVAALRNLTGEAGQFYYANNENILCVYNGQEWVQINPDTNTYSDDRVVTASYDSNTGLASVVDIIYDNDGRQLGANWDIKAGAGMSASLTPKYALAKAFHSGVQYYTLSGSTYTTATVTDTTFNPQTHYEKVGFELTLTPNAYVLTAGLDSATSNDLELTLSNGVANNNSVVTVKAGTNVEFTESSGEITLSAADTKATSIEVDPKANSGNGYDITIRNSDSSTATLSSSHPLDPIIRVGSAGAYEDTHFVGNYAALPVYSKTQIDSIFKTFNAMEWQGVVHSGEIPSSNIKNGYVYMAGDDLTTTGNSDPVDANVGDLIIATGTEGSDGYIPYNNITWQVVNAGNDLQDTYSVVNITNGLAFKKNTNTNIGGIEVKADTSYLTVTDSDGSYGTDAQHPSKVVTVNHKELHQAAATNTAPSSGTTQVSTDTLDIVVPSVSYDKAGHITAYTTATYRVLDTHAEVTNHTIGATVANNVATIEDKFYVDSVEKAGDFDITSNTLTLTASNGNLNVDLVWGSFN